MVTNEYTYTNLKECKMTYKVLSCDTPLKGVTQSIELSHGEVTLLLSSQEKPAQPISTFRTTSMKVMYWNWKLSIKMDIASATGATPSAW